ncbi:RICIN domain-containing protein [Campylobacter estrildidarum]|uniref:Cytolethal distending toxin subunit A n=1 Tax=Campylobacter estrildidarum TaxID=2510189 RepID=A0A4U7BL58_9BACT|nr:RICIN domain-containing protein [Campylobacter estrildidarum]TKX31241.1 cytolethal distending toxin subunit A [Campylobacter estrildidarum]
MKKIKYGLFFLTFTIIFSACSTKELNPLGRSYGEMYDGDPLKIGEEATKPTKETIPSLVEGQKFPAIPLVPPVIRFDSADANSTQIPRPRLKSSGGFNDVSVAGNTGYASDFVTIMNPNGAALTIWGTNPGNWIWGYSLYNSQKFGDARIWQLIEFTNDIVMIKNAQTGTCLNAYGNGIVHYPCDQSNHAQFWKLTPMSNGAYQISNLATQQCIQTPVRDVMHEFNLSSYKIFLTNCVKPGEKTLDRQWYITTPADGANSPY